ncbi:SH3 domain-containing protein [Pseudophaeobacter flagellatus]|uniref:SH3 domain-containing protein n=1 Tax=Pseudophaeobacter flagellatus TaxID=2899119 RepID=UPI001E454E80|nr:SH3 domain-containing protein [Pseudophaeobacter flagellatus]MCD9149441.1 SH3 domain-containing protein [Pseudophaeobacter flagellatus]
MSRFVIVSFAFLGLAFYEISGGGDFVPPERPDADPPHTREISSGSQAALDDKFQRPARLRAAELVGAAAQHQPSPAPAHPATTLPRPQADPEQRQAIALAKIAASGTSLQSSSSAFAATAETGLLHMDAAQGGIQGGLVAMTSGQNHQGMTLNTRFSNTAAQQPAPPPPPETYLDIRQIRASRVNMRQGPGTIYPVVGRLLAGDKVLVIEDSGTGWLNLRTQKGNKIGWVAASLVSKKAS